MSQPNISQYRPPRRRAGWLTAVLVAALVVGLGVTAWKVTNEPQLAAPSATPSDDADDPSTPDPSTPSANSTVAPSMPGHTPTGSPSPTQSTPFVAHNGEVKGTWRIDSTQWHQDEVVLTVSITVSQGTLDDYSFFMMTDDKATMNRPETSSDPRDISTGTIEQGRTVTGTLTIATPRENSMIVLAQNGGATAISALEVVG